MSDQFSQRLVLVVEDEPIIRLDLVSSLESRDYRVVEAATAVDALAAFDRSPEIRVVITDVRMPGKMNGLDLARQVAERRPPAFVVICSAHADEIGPLPGVYVLDKPVNQAKLTEVLHRVECELSAEKYRGDSCETA